MYRNAQQVANVILIKISVFCAPIFLLAFYYANINVYSWRTRYVIKMLISSSNFKYYESLVNAII